MPTRASAPSTASTLASVSYPDAPIAPVTSAYGPVGTRSTAARVGIWVGVVVGGLVLLMVVLAVAIPVYLDHRARSQASHTTFVLPATIDGAPQMSGNIQQTIQIESAARPAGWAAPQAAAYGVGTSVRAVVVIGLHYIPGSHQGEFLDGLLSQVGDHGWTVTDSPAGPLGGTMRCFETPQGPTTTCVFADYGAWGLIAVPGTGSSAHDRILAARAAVEHRS